MASLFIGALFAPMEADLEGWTVRGRRRGEGGRGDDDDDDIDSRPRLRERDY